MGDAYGKKEMHIDFSLRSLKEIDHLEDVDVDERLILKHIIEETFGGVEQINLAEDGGLWRACMKTVIDFRFP